MIGLVLSDGDDAAGMLVVAGGGGSPPLAVRQACHCASSPPMARGGPCAAGPTGEAGSTRTGGNPQIRVAARANPCRLTQTAAGGKPAWCGTTRLWRRGSEESDRWSRLGMARQAAARNDLGTRGTSVLCLAWEARGPDGTKGFVLERSRQRAEGAGGQVMGAGSDSVRDPVFGAANFVLFCVLLIWSSPWIGWTAASCWLLDRVALGARLCYQHDRPRFYLGSLCAVAGNLSFIHSWFVHGSFLESDILLQMGAFGANWWRSRGLVGVVMEFVWGVMGIMGRVLVLVVGCVEFGLEMPGYTFHLVCAGGLPAAGVLAITLEAGGGTWAEVALAWGVEGMWAMRRRGVFISESRGNRVHQCHWLGILQPEVNPLGKAAWPACGEAGRLRRRASAALQYKVFDPGRGRGR